MRNTLYGMLILTMLITVLWGCSETPIVKQGDRVKVHYILSLDNDSVIESSTGKEPIEFVAGSGQTIKGFDQGVLGMKVGEKKDVVVPPEEGYGMPDPKRVMEIDRAQIPPDMELVAGQILKGMGPYPVKVLEVADSTVTIDTNHPMAGKTLHFNLTLVEIVPPAEDVPAQEPPAETPPPTDEGGEG